jgi:hypothetical protein
MHHGGKEVDEAHGVGELKTQRTPPLHVLGGGDDKRDAAGGYSCVNREVNTNTLCVPFITCTLKS